MNCLVLAHFYRATDSIAYKLMLRVARNLSFILHTEQMDQLKRLKLRL